MEGEDDGRRRGGREQVLLHATWRWLLSRSKAFTQLFRHVPGECIKSGVSDWGDGLRPLKPRQSEPWSHPEPAGWPGALRYPQRTKWTPGLGLKELLRCHLCSHQVYSQQFIHWRVNRCNKVVPPQDKVTQRPRNTPLHKMLKEETDEALVFKLFKDLESYSYSLGSILVGHWFMDYMNDTPGCGFALYSSSKPGGLHPRIFQNILSSVARNCVVEVVRLKK